MWLWKKQAKKEIVQLLGIKETLMVKKHFLLVCLVSLFIVGCGELSVYDVQTKYSHSVMVPPVSDAQRSVFIRVKDTSGYASEIAYAIEQDLKKSGYKVLTDPALARFKLMVNVIKFGDGTDEDYLTYLKAIDPKQAAQLLIEKNTRRTVVNRTNVYEKDLSASKWPFLQPKKRDAYVDSFQEEEVVYSKYAQRVALADVEIIGTQGESLRTRIMTGVDFRGGLFVSPTPQLSAQAWTRLINRLAAAISNLF